MSNKIETTHHRKARTVRSRLKREIAAVKAAQMRLRSSKPPAKTKPRYALLPTPVSLVERRTGELYMVDGFRAIYVDRNKYDAKGRKRAA